MIQTTPFSYRPGWEVRSNAYTIIVGIVDSGIRLTHEDLIDNLWINPNETADVTDSDGNGFIDDIHGINAIALSGDPTDDQGHGTHSKPLLPGCPTQKRSSSAERLTCSFTWRKT